MAELNNEIRELNNIELGSVSGGSAKDSQINWNSPLAQIGAAVAAKALWAQCATTYKACE